MKTLEKMLKKSLILQIMSQKSCYQKVVDLMKNELGGKVMKEFGGLKEKSIQLFNRDNKDESKKAKDTKNVQLKENLNLKIIKIVFKHLCLKIK